MDGGSIAGIVVAIVVVLIVAGIFLLRWYIKGNGRVLNDKKLDGRLVVITGTYLTN